MQVHSFISVDISLFFIFNGTEILNILMKDQH
jgi:hypothetical protein